MNIYDYKFVGGELNGNTFTEEEAMKHWSGRFSPDWSDDRAKGYCVPREELDNKMKFDGYLGPMWEGATLLPNGDRLCHLRYETQEVYDMLSR